MKSNFSVLFASTTISAVAALVASGAGSCSPNEHVFAHHVGGKYECTYERKSAIDIQFACGPAATVIYNFILNQVTLSADSDLKDGLTVHGACIDGGNQVAHLDLHMPNEVPVAEHRYHGMNRVCDMGRARDPPKVVFTSYTLSVNEQRDCAKNPVTPIR